MKKKPVKYETFWMVFGADGLPRIRAGGGWTSRDAIREFLSTVGERADGWSGWYRKGYRCLKVGVVK